MKITSEGLILIGRGTLIDSLEFVMIRLHSVKIVQGKALSQTNLSEYKILPSGGFFFMNEER